MPILTVDGCDDAAGVLFLLAVLLAGVLWSADR